MRKDNLTSLWGDNKLILVEHTPDKAVESARLLVEECSSNQRGFCYSEVKRYPMDTGREIRQAIELLKRERMSCNTTKARASVISDKLKVLRHIERSHYLYDRVSYLKLRSTYDKLHKALVLLMAEGVINSFSLQTNGRLQVNWFTEHHFDDIVIIHQGWTYDDRQVWDHHRKLRERMFEVYNSKMPDSVAEVTGFTDTSHGDSLMDNSGFIIPQNYRPPASKAGAGNMVTTTDHYKHNIVHAPNRGGVTWATKQPLYDWLVFVIAYYTPAKELGKVVDTHV